MIPHLPDEIWLKILQYVPLQQRLQSVQFVDTRFNRLCIDRSLCVTLTARNGLRVPERKGIALLSHTSTSLQYVSFEDCHWLSESFFAKLPIFPSLISLNLGPCYLPPEKLYKFFSKCPQLQNLIVQLAAEDVEYLHAMHNKCPEKWSIKNLRRLHVVLDKSDTRTYVTAKVVQQLYDTFFPEIFPTSFSIEELHDSYISHMFHASKEVLDLSKLYSMNDASESDIFCENARSVGIHFSNSSCWNFDFKEVTFLSLPNTIWEGNGCMFQIACPTEMPSLMYLSIAMQNKDGLDHICGNKFSENIFFRCKLINLKCLKLHLSHFVHLEKFYTRLSHFSKLEELLLDSTAVKLNSFLKYIEPLEHLRSLSIRMDKSVYIAADEVTQCDGDEFLMNLYLSHPKIKKMHLYVVTRDHTARSRFLKTLKLFEDLEILKVDGFDVMNSLKFSKILKHLRCLTTLCLLAQDKNGSCDFDIFLRDSLYLLPRLTRLHFQHARVSLFNVLQNCSRCKNLEKIMIQSASEVSGSGALFALKQCTSDLLTLKMIAIICRRVEDELLSGIEKLQEQLQSSERRNILIYYGKLEYTPLKFHSMAFSHDFSPRQPYHFW